MGAFNLSSNPLSTLFPNLSPQQDPNYGNAFQIDLGNLKSTTSPMPDYAKQFAEETQPMLNQMKFKVGLMTSGSSNPAIAFKGKQMADEVVSDMNRKADQFSSIFPTDGSQTPNKPSFFSKIGGWQTVGAAADMLGSFMPEKDEYSGTKGDLTQTLDSTYDNIANTLMAIPGWGTLAGGIMKAGSFLGKGVNALGGGTSGMTNVDAILGSSFLSLTPFGLINGFGGSKTNTITKDEQVFETVGSSYTGTNQTVNDALTKSGKKYGLFSSKARNRANEEIEEAKRQQGVMSWVADEATDRFAIRDSMAAINGNRRKYYLQGGYNQADVRVGKSGMSLDLIAKAKKVLHESRKLKGGGQITPTEILLVVPEFQDGGQINKKSRTLQELIEYAKKENPRFIQRMSEPLKYIDLGNGDYATHLMGYEFDPDTQKWYVYSQVQEDDNGNLKLYDFPEAFNRALEKKNVLEMTQDEAKLFTESEELSDGTFKGYKAGWPEFFKQKPGKFQQGGSINVIPEGALHAHKHNMDMEGITKKGIPVIDNNGEQQAEIEREEIIFRKEVTKQLEELEKKFYDSETSHKEKDECALEAGKLLVEEILYNTQDNTNKLL